MIKNKNRVGRPKKNEADKVKVVSAYLTGKQHLAVEKKYGNITMALRIEVLPKC